MIDEQPGTLLNAGLQLSRGPSLTRAEFDALAAELRELRAHRRSGPADRLREARQHGSASVGCTVRIADEAGGATEYRLVGRRAGDADRHDASSGSPVGAALIGAVAGDVVRVELPGARVRELQVLQVAPSPPQDTAAERAA